MIKLPSNVSSEELAHICEYIKFLERRIKKLEEQILPKITAISHVGISSINQDKRHPQENCEDPELNM